MDIYNNLLEAVHNEYDTIRLIKKSERGEVSLVRHRDSGTRYIFRHFYGSSEVYQLLLTISCPYLPQIMEVGERDGQDCPAGRICTGGYTQRYSGVWSADCSRGQADYTTAVFGIVGASFHGGGTQGCKTGQCYCTWERGGTD